MILIQLERFENKVLFKDEFQEMGYLYSDEIEYSLKNNRIIKIYDGEDKGWIVFKKWKQVKGKKYCMMLRFARNNIDYKSQIEIVEFIKNELKEFDIIIDLKVPLSKINLYEKNGFTQLETLINYKNSDIKFKKIDCDVKINKADFAHLDKILEIDKLAFEDMWNEDEKMFRVQLNGSDADRKFDIALKNNEVVGYSIYRYRQNDKTGHVSRIGVIPKYQGQKIGNLLLQNSMEWLLEKGAKSIELTTQVGNRKSRPLYEKSGFRVNNEYAVMEYKI